MRAVARRKVVYVTETNRVIEQFAVVAPGFTKWLPEGTLMFACTGGNLDVWDQIVKGEIEDADGTLAAARMPSLPPIEDVPLKVEKPMFEHQRWMVSTALQRTVFGTFYDMGTGKSAIALWMASEMFLRGMIDQMLFVTVSNNIKPFMGQQAALHMPDSVPYRILTVPSPSFDKLGPVSGKILVIGVCSHGAFQGDKAILAVTKFAKRGRTLLVIDESTGFKGWRNKRHDNMVEFRKLVERVYLMSGDPSPHGLEDLFSQFYILDPRIIGHASITSFRNQYCIMVPGFQGREMVGGYKNRDDLYKKISPYCRFVNITDCHDMPSQTFLEKTFKPEAEQIRLYNQVLRDWKADLASGDSKVIDSAREKFVTLQTVANGWIKDSDGLLRTVSSARAHMVVEECESVRGKVIIWGCYHGDIDMLAKVLAAESISYVKFYGGQSHQVNSDERERFVNDPDVKVFLATAASGGMGLNLQVAAHMIYFSNSFNYGDRAQSERRIWRIGQEQHCVYVDVFGFPIDRYIFRNLRAKRDLSSEVRSLAGLQRIADELSVEKMEEAA